MTVNDFDTRITHAIQSWPSWLGLIMATATFVAYPLVLIIIACIAGIGAWKAEHPRIAVALTASLAGLGLNTIFKNLLHRARPDTLYVAGMRIKSYSFPSGHAFGSIAVYGLFAWLALKYLPQPWNSIVAVLLVALIILVGLSRIYLGAHYPTDVLGGWILGGIVLGLIILIVRP